MRNWKRNYQQKFVFANLISVCGGYLHQESGFITSPQYPRPYRPNEYCIWKVETDKENFIQLTIDHLDLESTLPCSRSDYIRIYDGEYDQWDKMRYRGVSFRWFWMSHWVRNLLDPLIQFSAFFNFFFAVPKTLHVRLHFSRSYGRTKKSILGNWC